MQRDQLTLRQQECLGLELLGLDVIVSEDMSCTALEVNSGPRQCADEDEMQYSMYEIALGLERSPVDKGMQWLPLGTVGKQAVASPSTGRVATWAGTNRVSEPAPAPAPAAHAAGSVGKRPSGQPVAAARAQTFECMTSIEQDMPGGGATQQAEQGPSHSQSTVQQFVGSMPDFI